MVKNKFSTPLGISKYVLLGIYAVYIALTAYPGGIPSFIRLLLDMDKSHSEYYESTYKAKETIEYITNRAFAAPIALSFLTSYFTGSMSPKLLIVSTVLSSIAGLVFMFFADVGAMKTAGAFVLGTTFTITCNAHMSISALFPSDSDLVQDVLGSAAEFSNIICILWYYLAKLAGSEVSVQAAVQYYAAGLIILSLLEVIFLPKDHYDNLITENFDKKNSSSKPAKVRFDIKFIKRIFKNINFKKYSDEIYLLDELTNLEQSVHPLFWLCLLLYSFAFVAKYHFLSSFDTTIDLYSANSSGFTKQVAQNLKFILSIVTCFCWASNVYLTRLCGECSVVLLSMVISFGMSLTFFLYCIPNVYIQILTIMIYWIWGTVMFNYCYLVIAEYFGEHAINITHALYLTIGGFICCLYPNFMSIINQPFVIDPFNETLRTKNFIFNIKIHNLVHISFFLLSLATISITYYEYILCKKKTEQLNASSEESRKLNNKGFMFDYNYIYQETNDKLKEPKIILPLKSYDNIGELEAA